MHTGFQLRAPYLYNLAMHYKGNRGQQLNTLLQEKRIKPCHVPLKLHDKKMSNTCYRCFCLSADKQHATKLLVETPANGTTLQPGHLRLQKSLKTAIPGVP